MHSGLLNDMHFVLKGTYYASCNMSSIFLVNPNINFFFIYFLQLNSFECLICQFYQLNYNRQKMVLTSYSRTKFIRYAS